MHLEIKNNKRLPFKSSVAFCNWVCLCDFKSALKKCHKISGKGTHGAYAPLSQLSSVGKHLTKASATSKHVTMARFPPN